MAPTREPLSREDAAILALGAGAIRGFTLKLLLLGGVRGVDEVRAGVAARLGADSRLRLRLAAGEPPAWEDDPGFSLDRHVVDGGATTRAGIPELVADAWSEPLVRDRPLWRIDVVAVGSDETLLVWRLHHALADGATAMRLARTLLLDGAEPETPPPAAPRSKPLTRRAGLRSAVRVPAALAREVARRGGRPNPFDRPAGSRRVVGFVDVSLDTVRGIAHAAPERVTVNDVVLAAVGRGLREWLTATGATADALRVKVPVSLHGSDDAAGNRDSFLVADLPLDSADPHAGLLAIASQTRAGKARRDAEAVDLFFRDLSHLSKSLERQAEAWARHPRVFTLNVSNVIGPRGDLSVLGAPLLAFHSLAEIAHRHALRVAVLSAGGRIGFGLCADTDTVGDLAPITGGIEAEIAALAP